MLSLTNATVSHGAHEVLAGVSIVVPPGARIGVVGANGAGKSTLLRALAGAAPPSLRVGYLPQERDVGAGETLLEYLARRTGVAEAGRELDALAARLAEDPQAPYAAALDRFLALGGDDLPVRAAQVCGELGLPARLEQPLRTLSGGEAARAALASILLARFDAYLLDEPTNDLDFAGLDRLERFVSRVRGSVVVVSHDREFLDRTVTRIVELDRGRLVEHAGGWSEYEAAREREREEHERRYALWAGQKERFADLHHARREQARRHGKGAGRRGTHALMSKTRAAAERVERLDADRVEKPWEPWRLRLELAPRARAGDVVATLEGAVVERGAFRLGPVDLHVAWGERIAVVGANGTGKSTLLDALVGRIPLAAGWRGIGRGVVFGELEQRREPTGGTLLDWFEPPLEEARTLLAKFDLYADHVLRPVATLSPGERTRALLALQMARGANCLVLDEPTNHLDLPAIEELERALGDYDGTLLLVTHDRRFLERVGVSPSISALRTHAGGRVDT